MPIDYTLANLRADKVRQLLTAAYTRGFNDGRAVAPDADPTTIDGQARRGVTYMLALLMPAKQTRR